MSFNYPQVLAPGPQGPVGSVGLAGPQGNQGTPGTPLNFSCTFTVPNGLVTVTNGLITSSPGGAASGWVNHTDNYWWESIDTYSSVWDGTAWHDGLNYPVQNGGDLYLVPRTTGPNANWHLGFRPTQARFIASGLMSSVSSLFNSAGARMLRWESPAMTLTDIVILNNVTSNIGYLEFSGVGNVPINISSIEFFVP
jgi:hypothetical protein